MDAGSWNKVKDVLFEALQRPAEERAAFVRQRCSDPEICAEALTLLKDCKNETDVLTTVDRILRLAAEEDVDDLEDLQPGTRIGPYTIVERLDRGGQGQVFLGNDQDLRRKVALKCLFSSRLDTESVRERILREARAAAAINHANIATVHHVIEYGDRAFMVMEYVEGENLSARLKRERLRTDEVVAIGRRLAAALSAAHARGVVHRDLKPGNIRMTPDGAVKVVDFGVAKFARSQTTIISSASTKRPSAATGPAVAGGGTPPYMSPEQLRGQPVDERSDVYSLGAVLFEMATGRRLYSSSDSAQLAEAQARGAPRVDAVDRRIPPALAEVIAKCLQFDLARRYQSALDVEIDLQAVERLLARPDRGELIRRWRARILVGVPLLVMVLVISGFVATVGFNNTFGRIGPFARFGVEPWRAYFTWGVLATVPSLIVMTLVAVAVLTVRVALMMLESIGPLGRSSQSLRKRGREAAQAAGLNTSHALAQMLTGLAVLSIVVLYWYYAELINAWTASFNEAPVEQLLPMGPDNFARLNYKLALDVITLAFGVGLYKVIKLRQRERAHDGKAGVAMLIGIVMVLVLMNELSYRTLTYRDFERVDLAGARCYITGQSGDELLVLCPGSSPPRNRAVRRDDPNMRRTGIIENVFQGISPARQDP
jgi:tRNA A-37 threonylcarbamoyl transferase component Bud32